MLYNKLRNKLKYFYRIYIPFAFRAKTRYFYPSFINGLVGGRINEVLEVYNNKFLKKNVSKLKSSLNYDQEIDLLHKAFKMNEIRSNIIHKDWWLDFITLCLVTKRKDFRHLNLSLIDRIEKSNFKSLEYWEVICISAFSIAVGLVEIGYNLHKKAIKIALSYPENLEKYESWKLKSKLSAYLETSNYSEFDRLFPVLESRLKKKYFGLFYWIKKKWKKEQFQLNYYREILKFYDHNINNYDPKLIKNNFDKFDNEQDLQFRKFIEDKKIVIVGPVDTKKKDGFEIDKADIVIRFNHIGKNDWGDPTIKGSRCDITYINNNVSEIMIKDKSSSLISDKETWVVCKDQESEKKILKKNNRKRSALLKVRSLKKIDLAVIKGNLLFLPNVLLDLARFRPKKITIFHIDFALTSKKETSYSAYIRKDYEKHLPIGLATNHDIFSQFSIIKFFWKRRFVKGDNVFEKIMKMDIKNYVKKYQGIYK